MKSFRQTLGFTLIEIIVVVAILGVLSVVLVSVINPLGQLEKARDSARKQHLRIIANALEQYSVNHDGLYPNTPGTSEDPDFLKVLVTEGYLNVIPKDPKQGSTGLINKLIALFPFNKNERVILGMTDDNKGFYTSDSTILDNPLVTGQFISSLDWVDLETSPGVYAFNKIDSKLSALPVGKRARLKIGGGQGAPLWLRNAPYNVPIYHVIPPNAPEYDTVYVWHPEYVSRLKIFLQKLGEYLDNPGFPYRSSIAGIHVPGGPAYTEMITPGGNTSFTDAQDPSPPYTRSAYLNAWIDEMDTMNTYFPTIPILSNLSQTWNDSGSLDSTWMPMQVGDHAAANYPSKIELQNASVPGTPVDLQNYFKTKAAAGIAVSAQIGWNKLTGTSSVDCSDGVSTVSYGELCCAYKMAYDMGARAIEVNASAFKNATLIPATEKWDAALKNGPAYEPSDCAGTPLTPTPTDTPTPTVTLVPTLTPTPTPGASEYNYLYDVALDRKSYKLWASLEYANDPNIAASLTRCGTPPTGYNYCVTSQ